MYSKGRGDQLLLSIPNLKERRSIQMEKILKENKSYLPLFFIIISLFFLSGCIGIDRTDPIINFFTADMYTITEGDSVTLSWEVTEATAVTIDPDNGPDIGLADLSGFLSVSPTTTTTYTLTATNSCGQLLFPSTITATVTIEVNPAILE